VAVRERGHFGRFAGRRGRGWLDTEWINLAATVASTAALGARPVAWTLADHLRGYLWLRRRAAGWPELAGHALAAAEADDEPQAQATAWLSRGDLDLLAGRFAPAGNGQNGPLPSSVQTDRPPPASPFAGAFDSAR